LPEKVSIEGVNDLDQGEFVAMFGGLYESSPWVAEEAWRERPFSGFSELHEAFVRTMRGAPQERRMDLIRAHPDLAGRAAVAGELTAESEREQASAGLDSLTPEEYEDFQRLNSAYRDKFGFPFVVCVREHSKETILASAAARLGHSRPEEVETALGEIARIARLRLEELVEWGEGS
jgi:OHCU decarboxylase